MLIITRSILQNPNSNHYITYIAHRSGSLLSLPAPKTYNRATSTRPSTPKYSLTFPIPSDGPCPVAAETMFLSRTHLPILTACQVYSTFLVSTASNCAAKEAKPSNVGGGVGRKTMHNSSVHEVFRFHSLTCLGQLCTWSCLALHCCSVVPRTPLRRW